MLVKKIVFKLSPTDHVLQIKTSGFVGAECKKATDPIIAQLGEVTFDEPTEEMHRINSPLKNQNPTTK